MKRLAPLAALLLTACAGAIAAQGGTHGREARVLRWLDVHAEEEIAFIEKVVNINSGTMNVEGVRKVGAIYREELDRLGFQTEWVELPADMQRAGHLVARKPGKGKRVLLIGHLDTVFPKDSAFQRFERNGHMAAGPGTNDMKGGDTVILYALRALDAAGLLDDLAVTVILNGDEEKPGKPLAVTRKPLIDAARRADYALGFEALVDTMDNATVARRGYIAWVLHVEGKRGHSSLIFGDQYGFGAIYEAARIIDAFRQLGASEPNLTMSPGRIVGGTTITDDLEAARSTAAGKRNVIPRVAEATGELRALTPEQESHTREAMKKIVAANLPGTTATITFEPGYPPMAPTDENQQLLAELDKVNRDLGRGPIAAVPPMRRGAADISFAAPHCPSLGGLGTLGSGDHSPDEKSDLRSVPVASKRAALLIYRLAHPGT